MSYVNADDVLPVDLIREIQNYVDGIVLYIPRKSENTVAWSEKNGTKERLAERNKEIVSRFYSGESIAELGKMYFLSEKGIQGIIHEYESSNNQNGGLDAVALNDGCFKWYTFQLRDIQRYLSGCGCQFSAVMSRTVSLPRLSAFIFRRIRQFLCFLVQKRIQRFLYAVSHQFFQFVLDGFLV